MSRNVLTSVTCQRPVEKLFTGPVMEAVYKDLELRCVRTRDCEGKIETEIERVKNGRHRQDVGVRCMR